MRLRLARVHAIVSEIKVVPVEVDWVSEILPVFVDVVLEDFLLIDKNRNIFVPDAVCLSLNTIGKFQVFDEGLLSLYLNVCIIQFFLECFLLPSHVLFGLEGHANLGKLEDDFE